MTFSVCVFHVNSDNDCVSTKPLTKDQNHKCTFIEYLFSLYNVVLFFFTFLFLLFRFAFSKWYYCCCSVYVENAIRCQLLPQNCYWIGEFMWLTALTIFFSDLTLNDIFNYKLQYAFLRWPEYIAFAFDILLLFSEMFPYFSIKAIQYDKQRYHQ